MQIKLAFAHIQIILGKWLPSQKNEKFALHFKFNKLRIAIISQSFLTAIMIKQI